MDKGAVIGIIVLFALGFIAVLGKKPPGNP